VGERRKIYRRDAESVEKGNGNSKEPAGRRRYELRSTSIFVGLL